MSFMSLECVRVCGVSWLEQDLQEKCWEGRHLDFIMFLSIPCIVVFAFLIPMISLLKLRRDRIKLYDNRKHSFRFGMLYSGYRENRWWWELVIWIRKLAMILVVTFGRAWARQLHLALGIMVRFFLFFLICFRPCITPINPHSHSHSDYHILIITPTSSLVPVVQVVALHVQHYGAPFDMKTNDGKRLHSVEVASLLVLVFMSWAAVFFTFVYDQQDHHYDNDNTTLEQGGELLMNVLALTLMVTNVVYVAWNLWLALVAFNKKENIVGKVVKVLKKVRTRLSTSTASSSLSATSISGVSKLATIPDDIEEEDEFGAVYGNGQSGGNDENPRRHTTNPMKVDRSSRRILMRQTSNKSAEQKQDNEQEGIELTHFQTTTQQEGEEGEEKNGRNSLLEAVERSEEEEEEQDKCWEGPNGEKWEVFLDPDTGLDFYFCERTGESTWEPPWAP